MTAARAWEMFAACVGQTALFDDERKSTVDQAKAVCEACPVASDCLEAALDREEPWGVWGGLTTTERRPLIRARKAAQARTA